MQTHKFGDGFSYGKRRGKFGIQQSTGGMFAFFCVMRRNDTLFAVFNFTLGRTAFFYVVQHSSGKQNMLLLFIKHLKLGQLQQGFTHHFGMRKYIAFGMPFRILGNVFHIGKPAETTF